MDELVIFLAGAAVVALAVAAYVAAVVVFAVFVGPFLAGGTALALTAAILARYCDIATGVTFRTGSRYHGPPAFPPELEEEPAYRQYFFGPALRDLARILREARRECPAPARNWTGRARDTFLSGAGMPQLVGVPIGLVIMVGLFVGSILSVVSAGLLALVHVTVIGLVQLLARIAIGVVRAADSLLLAAKNIRGGVICKRCREKIDYPSYECPDAQCPNRHRDIRPGRYGVFRRRCACGRARMPTLLILGSHRLPPYCAHCSQPMTPGVGLRPEIVVPLFGGRSAGKTRLIAAITMFLLQQPSHGGPPVRLADDDTERAYRTLHQNLRDDQPVAATRGRPVGYSLYLGADRAERLVHVFDAAGETFGSSDRTDELEYLKYAHTALFVLDPLSVPDFLRDLTPDQLARLDLSVASDVPPIDVFARVTQTLAQMPGRPRRLAVAVSKTDMLEAAGALPAERDADWVERWLCEQLRLGNLVRSIRHEFTDVGFFATAALAHGTGEVDPSITPLAAWVFPRLRLLSERGRSHRSTVGSGVGRHG